MKTAIVRGMWGDVRLKRRHSLPPEPYYNLLKAVKAFRERGDVLDCFYCYGLENKTWLEHLGFEGVRLLHPAAWASPIINDSFYDRFDGVRIFGMSYWWHKFKILEAALQDFDSVLWIDTDIVQKQSLPDGFFEELNSGADFRASLYVQRNWSWGAGWRHKHKWKVPGLKPVEGDSHRAAQIVPGCGYLYVRNKEVIKEALEIQLEHPIWLDHQVMACFLDRRHGGWIGEQAYLDLGYHTQGYYYGRQIYRPSEAETIFQAGKRYAEVP